ncbi:hypothetical protein [Chromobacterium haemolyticum]|uniref:hypothetical protein n=1 Tax=Chromobacterium TaxID=535 RepID=UPI0040575799
MALVKQSEFAEMHGVSRKTVTTWKQRGWLVFVGELVDVDASNALLKKYRTAGVGSVTSSQEGNKSGNKTSQVTEVTVLPGETAASAADRIISVRGAPWDTDEARRVKENYLALLHQLEYDQKSGAVVAVDEVVAVVANEYAKVRTKLMAIPAEQAPRLNQLKTVAEVQDHLLQIITEALEELTRDGGDA